MSIAKVLVSIVGVICVAVTVNYELKAKKLRQNRSANVNNQVSEMEEAQRTQSL